MKKYTNIHKLSDNKFLNLFHLDALTDSGRPFDYFFVSRRKADNIKLLTGDSAAEGVVIYPVLREDPEKIVLIRQYRYPLGDHLYELPAGLIDEGETPDAAAVREMKEETGLSFEVYAGGDEAYRRPFFMGAGFTDESCNAVFGYASGTVSRDALEDTESIQVLTADKKEVRRILKEEKVSIRAAYLLMNFLHADREEPFAFLQ
ncbi:MAG: NUDIX hydrolase [Lachnospiraceae bacterium]|jgi:ADP-ribose pyrophosphatase|nr:NUDIX hydrolase [Lachnospiraceae bacterium]MDE6920396.1 NUDIX hydrolase [Lachnospiraceae bacterium]